MVRKKLTARGDDETLPAASQGGVTAGKLKKKAVMIEDDDMYSISNELSEESDAITGKKKAKGKKGTGGDGVFASSNFGLLGNDDDHEDDNEAEDGEEPVISFSGRKKKSKSKSSDKSSDKFSAALQEEENNEVSCVSGSDEEGSGIAFTGKKKSSTKKGSSGDVVEPEPTSTNSHLGDDKADTSKKKKKKKKSGRTAQEDDDLDKILAELGEAPPVAKPAVVPSQEEKVNLGPEPIVPTEAEGEKDGEEEKEESAAAKKKKKKKEKKKEKKAAAAENVEEPEVESEYKTDDKKVPKHVREMQEELARRKEMEEKKAREEEEKRRKEEEERLRQEELERQAEEARRRKKEREKEKLLKKKQEGKLLTGKQKEEQKRLEARRNQYLANSGPNVPAADKDGASSKRPKYETKKSKQPQQRMNAVKAEENVEEKDQEPVQQGIVAELESVEMNQLEELESVTTEEKSEVANGVEENVMEDDEDEDWDAKSWDDVNIKVKGAFDDEEIDSEPEPVGKKEVKPPLVDKGIHYVVCGSEPAKPTVSAEKLVKQQQAASEVPKQAEDLRSPICCIMGHVDAGKTKLLDCIRGTNVQGGEAGGITQQIGATYFPAENIRGRTKELKADATLKVPGLLVIDTPGHESFTNLRSRGSGLCDIAILVVDITDDRLKPQTIESLNLLKKRNTEFIVALNKVDRLYGWKPCRNAPFKKAMKEQTKDVKNEFNRRLIKIVTQFKEQRLNTELYYNISNKEMGETFSIVPTSAISGEGIPDLLLLLVYWTQKTMAEKLTFSNKVQCTVLEVKVIEGHGTTIDVVLINGVLHEGDQIVVCGLQGPVVTTIRALLTPHPMKEIRVKGTYLHHKEIKAAQGIKISAQGLEHAIAGTSLYVVGPDDDLEDVKEVAIEDMKSVMSQIDTSGEGVYVQASTLGSLEALLEFLKTPAVNIPVSGIGIGPVHKKDVMKASVMLEKKKKKEYAAILAFDVKVTPEAHLLAHEQGVTIFMEDIIYRLCDQFKSYVDNIKEERKKEAENDAVFPCILKIQPNSVFNKKNPIILGVDVLEGIAKIGTPICIPQRDFIDIGRIASIQNNEKPVDYAKKGQKVSIKIVGSNPEEQQRMFGRRFDMEDELVSRISRTSIYVLDEYYREDLSKEDRSLVKKLQTLFKI